MLDYESGVEDWSVRLLVLLEFERAVGAMDKDKDIFSNKIKM